MKAMYAAPWAWDGAYPIRITDYAGYTVCDGIMPARYRDARLIAVSPAMHALLSQLAESIERLGHGSYSLESREGFDAQLFMDQVRSVLAKAEGSTP